MRAFREGTAERTGGAACSFIVPRNGSHWIMRASAPDAPDGDPVAASVMLIGQSGETELFGGQLKKVATLIELPVTLPGERLAVRVTKAAKIAFEISWIQHGPPMKEGPCDR